MAVAFRAAGTFAYSAVGTPAVPYPAGLAANDILVLQYVCQAGGSSVIPTTPSGWTVLLGPTSVPSASPAMNAYVYYKVASGSESGSLTVANTGAAASAAAIMAAYSGANTATPINASGTGTGTGGVAPSVTTTVANTQLLHMYWAYSVARTVTPAAGDTERYDVNFAPTDIYVELADAARAATGATGTSTATYSGAILGGLAATIAVAPAPTVITPVADFTGTPLTGVAPLNVTFTDTSTNTPTSWAWTFGDGGTSTSQNPTHSYTNPGTYTVVLVATNTAGSDTKTRTGYVTAASGFVPQITGFI